LTKKINRKKRSTAQIANLPKRGSNSEYKFELGSEISEREEKRTKIKKRELTVATNSLKK